MSELIYPGPDAEPVRAWEVLEAKASEHSLYAANARDEYEAFTKRLARVELAIQYHDRGFEECISAANVLREAAGRPTIVSP